MKYLHSMVRVRDVEASLRFYCEGLGLRETRRMDNPQGKFTLIFLAADDNPDAEIELTHNWGSDERTCHPHRSPSPFCCCRWISR